MNFFERAVRITVIIPYYCFENNSETARSR